MCFGLKSHSRPDHSGQQYSYELPRSMGGPPLEELVWYGMMQAQYRPKSTACGLACFVSSEHALRSWRPTIIGNVILGLCLQRISPNISYERNMGPAQGMSSEILKPSGFAKACSTNPKFEDRRQEGSVRACTSVREQIGA